MEGTGLYIGMFVCLFAMLWARSQAKKFRRPWGRPLAAIFGILALVLAFTQIQKQATHDDRMRDDLVQKENFYLRSAFFRTGEYIAQRFPGKKITVFAYDEHLYNKGRQEIMLTALKDGLADNAQVGTVVRFALPMGPDEVEMIDVADVIVTAKDFDDKLIEHFDSTDLFLSLIPLPLDMEQMEYFKLKAGIEGPKLMLAFSSVYELSNVINLGLLDSVLTYHPDFRYNLKAPIPETVEAAFDERYLIVDQSNVVELADKYPRLLREITHHPMPEELEQ